MLPGVSIVIPVFNSEHSLPELHGRLAEVLEKNSPSGEFEIIFVDDGSRDGSWNAVESLAAADGRVRGLRLGRNYGQHNAILRGIRAARYELTVTLDDDLQHPPEEIPKLLEKLSDGCDVVYGAPAVSRHELWRTIASKLTRLALGSAIGPDMARDVSAFRAFRTHLREAFADYQSSFVSIDVLLTWSTAHFASVHVAHDARPYGRSNYTFPKLIRHALNMMTGYSVFPLQLASLIGFGFTLVGALLFLFVIGRYFIQGGNVPGFPFLASVITIFSGAQLFALGIIGEYLARMHFKMMGQPYSFVRKIVGVKSTWKDEIE